MELAYGYRLLMMLLIIGLNGFFAGAEAALISVRQSRLREMAGAGRGGAQAALALLSNPERLLSVVQVGVTLTSLALGWVGEDTIYAILRSWLEPVLPQQFLGALHIVSIVIAFVIMTFAHVVIGEVVPKNLAIDKADGVAVLVAPALLVFYKVTEPFVWAIERSATALSRLIGVKGEQHGGGHSAEELKFIIASSQSAGHLTQFEEDAIQHLIELQEYAVREIMVPRNQITMVHVDDDLDDVLQVVGETRYSRLPVYGENREDIIGIVHVKDVLDFWRQRRQSNTRRRSVERFDLRRLARKPLVFPETKPLNQVLDDLRRQHAQMALVVDEFGTVSGIISMEDVMEQIFGEIEDEFDAPPSAAGGLDEEEPEPLVFEVEGTIPIRDLEMQYGIELPSEDGFETLAGFILFRLGRIPKVGDTVDHQDRRFTVVKMEFNRIAVVRVERLQAPPEPEL